ncbi:MAG: hypothetical protein ACRCUY_03715 [Thermoguttaceae bacterium]
MKKYRITTRFGLVFLIASFLMSGFDGSCNKFCTATETEDVERIADQIRNQWPPNPPFNEDALKKEGGRRLDGKHIALFTDLPASTEIDAYPDYFDKMVGLLCDLFQLKKENYENFHVEVFLIDNIDRFKSSGAVRQVPKLRTGYELRGRIWLLNQSSDYYRRHLFLHEGVHAFMEYAFGNWGDPWFREGIAEVAATHLIENNAREFSLKLCHFPSTANELSRWGRIEILQNDLKINGKKTLRDIFALKGDDYYENEAYSWSFAFAAFCFNHPDYRDAFLQTSRALATLDRSPLSLADAFLLKLQIAHPETKKNILESRLQNDWDDFQKNICYNYDFENTLISYNIEPVEQLSQEIAVDVISNRGWQSSGIRLEKGKSYFFTASGRFEVAENSEKWMAEANGITISYNNGKPLGILIAALIPEEASPSDEIGFFYPIEIGTQKTWTPPISGTLFFRINSPASNLHNNNGKVHVQINPGEPPT